MIDAASSPRPTNGLRAAMQRTVAAAFVLSPLAAAACSEPVVSAEESGPAPGVSLFSETADAQWRLPDQLREISGLALAPDGRLFGHDDEVGVIHEIDIESGALRKRFELGDPVELNDFEGLAITPDGDFHLVTSRGLLYRFREGEDRVDFETFDTGLGDICEIEGLTYLASEQSFILGCKQRRDRDMRDMLVELYAWSMETMELKPWLTTPMAPVAEAVGARRFSPSAVEIDPDSGRVILLSARGGSSVVELDASGSILYARRLPESHAQAEGVAIQPGGALLIADEGDDGRALLTRYPRR